MDAAILFADILLVPQALGQELGFGDEGPHLDAITSHQGLAGLRVEQIEARLEPVCETIQRCRAALSAETALIGFAGAPWTVATYMVEGGGSRDFLRVKGWPYRDPGGFQALIDLLIEATIAYLGMQVAAGAEAVQLFDSWAGILPEDGFDRWVTEPTRRITAVLRERFPHVPVIGFPRGAGLLYERYAKDSGVTALGLDTTVPLDFAHDRLQPQLPVQGNLDPILLATGGAALERAVRDIRTALGNGAFVFNLGHGIVPQTPPENVAALARLLAEPF
jgi:uroporphyrinogen decarboxylase